MNDEANLIAQVQRGDLRVYDKLVHEYESVAFRTAFLVVRDSHDAADVVQDAFVRAYQSIGSFKLDKPFRPWLLRIVTNVSLNRIRSTRRRENATLRLVLSADDSDVLSPDLVVVLHEQGERLLQAVGRLTLEEQALVSLRYLVDLSESEIAETLQIPIGTVKSRLHRTLARLREVIQQDFPDLREWTVEL